MIPALRCISKRSHIRVNRDTKRHFCGWSAYPRGQYLSTTDVREYVVTSTSYSTTYIGTWHLHRKWHLHERLWSVRVLHEWQIPVNHNRRMWVQYVTYWRDCWAGVRSSTTRARVGPRAARWGSARSRGRCARGSGARRSAGRRADADPMGSLSTRGSTHYTTTLQLSICMEIPARSGSSINALDYISVSI